MIYQIIEKSILNYAALDPFIKKDYIFHVLPFPKIRRIYSTLIPNEDKK